MAQLQRAAEAATSASENSGSISSWSFLFPPRQHFFEPFSLILWISTFLCSLYTPPPHLPYSLGFSAGKLPGLASKVLYLLAAEPFCSALFLQPFAGFTAKCEGMPLPPHATSSCRPAAFSRRPLWSPVLHWRPRLPFFSWSPHCVSHSTTRFWGRGVASAKHSPEHWGVVR